MDIPYTPPLPPFTTLAPVLYRAPIMLTRSRSFLAMLVATSILLTQSGCMTWMAIQPSELSRLQTGTSQAISAGPQANITLSSVQTVTKEDGKVAQITGNYDLRLTTNDDVERIFDHPVVIEPSMAGYYIKGSNRKQFYVGIGNIKRVEVSTTGVTTFGIVMAGTGAALLILLLVLYTPGVK